MISENEDDEEDDNEEDDNEEDNNTKKKEIQISKKLPKIKSVLKTSQNQELSESN